MPPDDADRNTALDGEGPLCANCGDCMCTFCKASRLRFRGNADCCNKPTPPNDKPEPIQQGKN